MAAAFLLFGFSLLYGLTGSIELPQIAVPGAAPAQPAALRGAGDGAGRFRFQGGGRSLSPVGAGCLPGRARAVRGLDRLGVKAGGLHLFTRLLWPGLGAPPADPSAGGGPGWIPIAATSSRPPRSSSATSRPSPRPTCAGCSPTRRSPMPGPCCSGDRPGQLRTGAAVLLRGHLRPGDRGGLRRHRRHRADGRRPRRSRSGRACPALPVLAGCLPGLHPFARGHPAPGRLRRKFVVFAAALKMGGAGRPEGWLAVLAIALSAVALYYYLLVLKQALVAARPPARAAGSGCRCAAALRPGGGRRADPAARPLSLAAARPVLDSPAWRIFW